MGRARNLNLIFYNDKMVSSNNKFDEGKDTKEDLFQMVRFEIKEIALYIYG